MSRLKNYKFELNEEQSRKIRRVFNIYADRSGIVKLSDMLEGMREVGVDEKNPEVYDLISQLNSTDYKNGIKFEQLIEEIDKKIADRNSEEAIERIFQYYVQNPNKQTITVEDIQRLANEIGEDMEEDQARRIMNKVAKNGKDLTFDEFYTVMTKKVQY
jgi:Ca2+-binding EF-hand superfamily protein